MPKEPFVVRLDHKEWDVANHDELDALLAATHDEPDVVVDLRAVNFMDSTCLRAFARMYTERAIVRGHSPARLVVTSPHLLRVFAIVKFDQLWPIYTDFQEAYNSA